jgi:2-C-methyl-D-erythritol 4-phosphate cytidylyltransferase
MNVAIIAAGGKGSRMGGEVSKQFLLLNDIPVIIHTLRRFEQATSISDVVVVAPSDEISTFLDLASRFSVRKLSNVVAGGGSRMESVWKGIQSIRRPAVNVVAIHDAVRPLVTSEAIDRTVAAADKSGAAILAIRAVDSIKKVVDLEIQSTLRRSEIWHAQTPQCFHMDILKRAYANAVENKLSPTDDSELVENIGVKVSVVEGDNKNIKITLPEDIALAEIILTTEES